MKSLRFFPLLCLLASLLLSCDRDATTSVSDGSWTASFRVASSLTDSQLSRATWVRVQASRSGVVVASDSAPYAAHSVTLTIPSAGAVDIRLTGLNSNEDTVMWTGTGTIADGVSKPGNVVTLVAGPGLQNSTTGTVAAPTFSIAGGTYTSAQTVTLASTTSGASIYYTTDGSAPTSSSTLYAGALTVSSSETLKAIAVKSGWTSSSVTSATYTISSATPAKPQYTLTVAQATGGTISLSKTGSTFDSGTTVIATAAANSGYTFSGWSGASTSKISVCTLSVTQNLSLSASFAVAASTDTTLASLTVSSGMLSPVFSSKTTSYHDTVGSTATTVTLAATATAAGASVSGMGVVSLNALSAGDSVTKTITVTNGTKSLAYTVVIVKRALPKYTLTVTQPANGTITLSPAGGVYDSGTTVIATAAANSGYTFSGWSGASKSTISVCTLTVTTNLSLSAIFTSSITPTPSTGDTGHFTDSRDGQSYKYVKIGTQTWMAQNLNYQVDSSWCYGGVASNCSTYGRLYRWSSAMALSSHYDSTSWGGTLPHQGICPSGWHVPSDAEWQTLEVSVGMSAATAATTDWRGTTEGTKLKANSSLWSTNTGTDAYGFSVLPAGYRLNIGTFNLLGLNATFWSSSEYDASLAWSRGFYDGNARVYRNYGTKSNGFSLRCLEN